VFSFREIDKLLLKSFGELENIHPELHIQKFCSLHHYYDENAFKYINVALFNEGKVFGELGILNKKLRAATITCN
jgi:hypothetical protein